MANAQFITKKGYENLKKELDFLKTVERRRISSKIQEAKELGDLSENAEYSEAKDEQAANEKKIVEIEMVLKDLKVIRKNDHNHYIDIGSTVKVKTPKGEILFTIVGSEEANPREGRISNLSPIGHAILGKKVGEKVNVEVPSGQITYEIIAIE